MRRLGLIYPAFLSRAETTARISGIETIGRVWPRDPDGAPHYPGDDRTLSASERDRRIAAGDPHAWRLDMQTVLDGLGTPPSWAEFGSGPSGETGEINAEPGAWGDVILARRDVPASYHLSVTVDDAIQNISDVIRGEDLFAATSVHRLLQHLLGLPAPRYHHHDLVRDQDGRKLSKSDGSTSIASLRQHGASPDDILVFAGVNT